MGKGRLTGGEGGGVEGRGGVYFDVVFEVVLDVVFAESDLLVEVDFFAQVQVVEGFRVEALRPDQGGAHWYVVVPAIGDFPVFCYSL